MKAIETGSLPTAKKTSFPRHSTPRKPPMYEAL
jgi:hypothetical protein